MEKIIFDLDGVLASDKTTRHLVECAKPDYAAFNNACGNEKPNPVTVKMAQQFYRIGYEVRVHTARSIKVYKKTREWLHKNGLDFVFLVMRPDWNTQPAAELKAYMAKVARPVLIFENDAACIKEYKKLGLSVVKTYFGK
ncbi:phosphoglycolate phosphatase-like HAD superfamily hydrolase [Elusimicrobium simillimum]|uniref:hypothetical protein n=1 Tax=Elusimicrobium simillimum TaxID=3143438 RepID=UPI003C6EAD5E